MWRATKQICGLIFPPIPSRIASKLSFFPPVPTYTVGPARNDQPSLRVVEADREEQEQEDERARLASSNNGGGSGKSFFASLACSSSSSEPPSPSESSAAAADPTKDIDLSALANVEEAQKELYLIPYDCACGRTVVNKKARVRGAPVAEPLEFHIHDADEVEAMLLSKNCRFYRIPSGTDSICVAHFPVKGATSALIYSHGNAMDIGQQSLYLMQLADILHVSIFAYEYSGYGDSTGSPSEAKIYENIEAVFDMAQKVFGFPAESIFLYGQSIGSAPTVNLASKRSCKGVILHAALMSGLRVIKPEVQRSYFFDPFQNIEKIKHVTAPVLVMHGTEDEIIGISHGKALAAAAPNAVEPLWIEGGMHNNLSGYDILIARLFEFVTKLK